MQDHIAINDTPCVKHDDRQNMVYHFYSCLATFYNFPIGMKSSEYTNENGALKAH